MSDRPCPNQIGEGQHGGVYTPTKCGCTIIGEGTLPSPLQILFCGQHLQGDEKDELIVELRRGRSALGSERDKIKVRLKLILEAVDELVSEAKRAAHGISVFHGNPGKLSAAVIKVEEVIG